MPLRQGSRQQHRNNLNDALDNARAEFDEAAKELKKMLKLKRLLGQSGNQKLVKERISNLKALSRRWKNSVRFVEKVMRELEETDL